MGLSMVERKAVTKQMARRYERAAKGEKGRMLESSASSRDGAVGMLAVPSPRRSAPNPPTQERDVDGLGSMATNSSVHFDACGPR